jgi:D-glycero-D-manno-heptose 1,7-bisphosphate phosphatase
VAVTIGNVDGPCSRAGRPAVFLDKDGTLIVDVPYNVDPTLIRLTDGAIGGLRALHEAGYLLVVVSNQSGVARGIFEAPALHAVEARLRTLLGAAGVPLAGFYFCPHHPGGAVEQYAVSCECRKPAPGLLLRAAADLGINVRRSWLVGDILHDIEAGRRAGCRTILLDVGHETEWEITPTRTPDATAANLDDAARLILRANQEDHRTVPELDAAAGRLFARRGTN